jgi:hypothetical protein
MKVPYAASLALLVGLTVAGCSSGVQETQTPGGSGTTPVLTGSPSPSRSVTTSPAPTSTTPTPTPTDTGTSSSSSPVPPADGVVAVGTVANGSTVRLRVGQQLLVTLDNTYWQFDTPTGVLHAGGPQITKPAQPGTCLPGIGCGTVRLAVSATTAGRGDVTAGRTTCGEAMACRPDQAHWVVHVVVG